MAFSPQANYIVSPRCVMHLLQIKDCDKVFAHEETILDTLLQVHKVIEVNLWHQNTQWTF
jgi:hypothetical protein